MKDYSKYNYIANRAIGRLFSSSYDPKTQGFIEKKIPVVEIKEKAPRSEFSIIVAKLTNWQRHQWAKQGSPGLANKDHRPVEKYLRMERPSR